MAHIGGAMLMPCPIALPLPPVLLPSHPPVVLCLTSKRFLFLPILPLLLCPLGPCRLLAQLCPFHLWWPLLPLQASTLRLIIWSWVITVYYCNCCMYHNGCCDYCFYWCHCSSNNVSISADECRCCRQCCVIKEMVIGPPPYVTRHHCSF